MSGTLATAVGKATLIVVVASGAAALAGMGLGAYSASQGSPLTLLGFGGNPGAGYGWWQGMPQDPPGANTPPVLGRLPNSFNLVVEQEASGSATGAEGMYTMSLGADGRWYGSVGRMNAEVRVFGSTYEILFQLHGAGAEDYWGGNTVLGASYSGRVMFWRVNGRGGIVKCVATY